MADNIVNGHRCEECGKSYNKKWRLVEHLRSHTGERPYKCWFEGCGKSYIRPFHLKRHVLSHTGQQPSFECSYPGCTKTFSEKHNLKRHEQRSHNKPFKCNFEGCIQAFKKSSQLRRHTCVHTNESPYKCEVEGCDRGFETSTKLKRHMKVHNKGYICSVPGCSEAFDKFSKLRTHICSHGFECQECKKTFPRAFELQLHAEIHNANRKLYECPREGCSRVYTRERSLKSHIKTYHDGVRPFLCTVEGCGKGFAYKVSLKRHLVLHSQNKIRPTPPPEQKKKPKKKKKPVSLARRLSGYRSSQSDSSDNLAEIPQKRRKVQSKLQRIASTYKSASTKALSQARAGGQSTTHSDTNTRDVAEEVNTSDVVRSDVMQVCDTPRNVLTSAEGSGEQPAENIPAVVDEEEQMQGCDGDTPGNLLNVAVCGQEPSMSTSTVSGPFASIEENREAEEIESVSCATVFNNSTSHESGIRVVLDPFAGLTASLVGCKITNSHKDVSEQVEGGSGEDSRVVDSEKESSSPSTVANNSPFTNLTQEQINAQSVLDDLALSSDEDGEGDMDWESDNSHFVETEHDSAYDFESVLDSSQVIATRDNLALNGAEKAASEVLSNECSKESIEAGESPLRSNLASSLPEKERSNTNSKSCKDSNSMQFERLSTTTDFSPVDDTSDGEHRRVDSSQSSAARDKDAALEVTVEGDKELAIHCEEETMDLQEEQRPLVNISSSADKGTTHESATGSESGELLDSVFDTRDKPTNERGVERGVDTLCGNDVRVRQLSREKAALQERGSNSDQRARGPHIIACNEVHVSRDTNTPKTVTSRLRVAEDVSNIGGNEVSVTGSKGRGRNTPQDKNSRNVSGKKSSNKRSAKTPAKKGPGKNSKRSQIASDKTNSQVIGNDVQTTKSSTSREKPKKTDDQAESLEEVAKAQFRNRSSIFAHDMQTLELLWNFKGR